MGANGITGPQWELGNCMSHAEDFKDPFDKYFMAFENIQNDVNQELIIVENEAQEIIGTFQLSFIQYLTYQGLIRGQINAVRIRKDHRGRGIGEELFKWGISGSKERGGSFNTVDHR